MFGGVGVGTASWANPAMIGGVAGPFAGHASLSSGLVSYWPLDESSGTRADAVGSNDLTDNNTVLYQNLGPQGNVTAHVAASNELLTSPSGIANGLTSFTINYFGKVSVAGRSANIDGEGAPGQQRFFANIDANLAYVFNTAGSGFAATSPVLADSQWHMYSFTYNSSDQKLRTYRDGVLIDTSSALTGTPNFASNAPIALGGQFYENTTPTAGCTGNLATAGFWSSALDTTALSGLYNGGAGKAYADLTAAEKVGLVSYWDLDEASGNRADSHGSNTLTDNNTVTSVDNTHPGFGKAASFVAANNEYLSRADGANTVWGEDGNGCTYIGWINLQNSTTYGLVFGRNSDDGTERGFEIITENNAATPVYANGTFGGSSLQVPIVYVATGWHMVAMWFDPADSKLRISIDDAGTQTTSAAAGNTLQASSKPISIGKGYHGTITGLVGPTAIWSRVLTAQERTDLYNSGAGLFY